jgi:hypothetical protein
MTPDRPSIPLVAVDGKQPKPGAGYTVPVTITLNAGDEEAWIAYTLDGQEPSKDSPRYDGPIVIDQPGDRQLRARLITDRVDTPTVSCAIRVIDVGKQ